MSLTVSESGNSFELCPEGTHPARCYRLIDLGSQETEWQGLKKQSRKILIQFEVLGDERMSDGRPFQLSKRVTASLGEAAALRKMLESWRGKAFSADELRAFDLTKLLGSYALVNVVRAEKNGRTYANLAGIMPLPKGMPRPDGINELAQFDLAMPDWEVFEGLSDNLRAVIAGSPEYVAASKRLPGEDDEPAGGFDIDEDIPF
jgi:hypothetical protein